MRPQLHTADVLAYAAAYTGEPYHAALLDPPYELNFMSRSWDNTGIAFRAETWAAFMPLLYPGAFGMAFAGSRGLHRMMVAIEDAGYLIHPVIGWCYGSGFPKATRIDTQIDAAAGVEREVVGTRLKKSGDIRSNNYKRSEAYPDIELTETLPATDLARAWAGHRYGLQALKPALEFIVVFQKPYAGRPVDSMVATGAGALNIDGARVQGGARPLIEHTNDLPSNGVYGEGLNGSRNLGTTNTGRWPANLVLSHAPECAPPDCVPGCAVAALGAQSGESSSNGQPRLNRTTTLGGNGIYQGGIGMPTAEHHDSGTAARYFFQADYAAERLEAAEPLFYCAKASTAEREAGLSGRQKIATETIQGRQPGSAGSLTPYAGVGGGSVQSDGNTPRANIHPTCKPIALARHLATLLLPPALYAPRRLFIPFAGVASECIGAMQAGWETVDGVELEQEHVEIGRARIAWWAEQGVQLTLFDDSVTI